MQHKRQLAHRLSKKIERHFNTEILDGTIYEWLLEFEEELEEKGFG